MHEHGQVASSPLRRSASTKIGACEGADPDPLLLSIWVNDRCSGYFVKPMKWMERSLHSTVPLDSHHCLMDIIPGVSGEDRAVDPAGLEGRGGPLSGTLTCPTSGCRIELGTFNWAGVQCGCGTLVEPGFCISRKRVDEIDVVMVG